MEGPSALVERVGEGHVRVAGELSGWTRIAEGVALRRGSVGVEVHWEPGMGDREEIGG